MSGEQIWQRAARKANRHPTAQDCGSGEHLSNKVLPGLALDIGHNCTSLAGQHVQSKFVHITLQLQSCIMPRLPKWVITTNDAAKYYNLMVILVTRFINFLIRAAWVSLECNQQLRDPNYPDLKYAIT